MKVYCLRNDKGEYISMSGTKTPNWLEASKFGYKDVERRVKYSDPGFKLVTFEVKEEKVNG